MRAKEILQEQKLDDGSELVATVGPMWIWRMPVATYLKVHDVAKNEKYKPSLLPPAGSDAVWYVSDQKDYRQRPLLPNDFDSQNWKYSHQYLFVAAHNNQLVPLAGRKWITPAVLRKLAAETGTTDAPTLRADHVDNHVLYQGKVQKIRNVAKQYAQPGLSDGSTVMAVPRSLLWTLGHPEYEDEETRKWDSKWRISHPTAGSVWLLVDQDQLIQIGHIPSNKIFHLVRSIRELANRQGWKLAVTLPEPPAPKKKMVKPGSVMHKMLAYLAEHPGANRSDWFVKHLGYSPQGMQGWTSEKAHDGVAASMGWIENKGTGLNYSLHLTMLGNLMLGRLNAGMPAPYTDPV